MKIYHFAILLVITISCSQPNGDSNEVELLPSKTSEYPTPEYSLSKDQTHNKFSNTIPPVLHVKSGAVIEAYTEEATDGQLTLDSDTAALMNISFDPIHPLTGPVFVEEAESDVKMIDNIRKELVEKGKQKGLSLDEKIILTINDLFKQKNHMSKY